MSQHSEERLLETEGPGSMHSGAQILPFERPQSELQRAIQQRAQETLDVNRERDREKRRPQPLKWITIFALACIPVLLTLSAVDGFLRVFHKVAAMYSSMPSPQQQQSAPAENSSGSEPGIVMLQSYDAPADRQPEAQRNDGSSDSGPPAAEPPPQR